MKHIVAVLQAVEAHLEHDEVHEQSEAKRKEVAALLKAVRECLAKEGA